MKQNTFTQKEFWPWILAALLISSLTAVLVYFMLSVLDIKLNDSVSASLVTLAFTLPFTFVSALMVVKSNERNDTLKIDTEVREHYTLAKKEYLAIFHILKQLAQALQKPQAELSSLLIQLKAKKYETSQLDDEEREQIRADRSPKPPHEPVGLDDIAVQQYHEKLLTSFNDIRDVLLNAVEKALNKLLISNFNAPENRGTCRINVLVTSNLNSLKRAVDKVLNKLLTCSLNISESVEYLAREELKRLCKKQEEVLERLKIQLAALPKERVDRVTRKDREFLELLHSIEQVMQTYDQYPEGLIKALLHFKVVLLFSKGIEPNKEFIDLVLRDYYYEKMTISEARTPLLSWLISPTVFSPISPSFAEDEEGNQCRIKPSDDALRASIQENNIGTLALNDLLNYWPTRKSLVECVFTSEVDDIKDTVLKKLNQSMPEPEVLIRNLKNS
jgi:hypothetical protein